MSDMEIVSAFFLSNFFCLCSIHIVIYSWNFSGCGEFPNAKLMKRAYAYWQARFLMVASLPIYLAGNSQHLISGPRRQEGSQPSSHQYGEFASPPPESCQAPKHQNLLNESQHNSYFLFTLENLDNKVHRTVFKHKAGRDHRCR